MPKFVATDVSVTLNGTAISSNLNGIELALSANEVETTSFGDAGWKTVTGGIKSGSVRFDFMQDFGAGAVDALLYPLFNTNATVVIKPTSSTVSATNPAYTAVVLVNSYTPLSASTGDLVSFSITLPTTGAITRATA
jgi:predicted secreted protein